MKVNVLFFIAAILVISCSKSSGDTATPDTSALDYMPLIINNNGAPLAQIVLREKE